MSWFSRLRGSQRDRNNSTTGDEEVHAVSLNTEEPVFGAPEEQRQTILPVQLHRQLVRLSWRSIAFVFWFVAGLFSLSRISYSPLDPSWNTATSSSPTNILGRFGAYLGDVLVQGFGFASWVLIALLFFLGVWVWNSLAFPWPLRRFAWLLLSLILWSLAFAMLPFLQMAGGLIGFILVSFVPAYAIPLALPVAAVVAFLSSARIFLIGPKKLWAAGIQALRPQASNLALATEDNRRWRDVFKRRKSDTIEEGLPNAIPSFLAQGEVADNSSALSTIETDVPSAPHEGAQQVDLEPTYLGETPRRDLVIEDEVSEKIPVAPWDVPPASDQIPNGSPEFISLDGSNEEEEIELLIQRPSAELVETAQLARQKKTSSEASSSDIAAPSALTASYEPPALNLLYEPTEADRAAAMTQEEADETARRLEETLKDYGVKGEITRVLPGPVVTLYELEPAPGTKTSRVVGLADDISRSMAALSARIAPVPGKSVIGIELPNSKRETVFLHEMLAHKAFSGSKAALPLALGKDIGGQMIMGDLAQMPHLLVAGTTGSGKSVAVNTMLLSLVYALSPEQVRFIMIDPKILELSIYDGIPHLLSPVVTDPKKAVVALKWVVQEMNQRYQSMSTLNVRNIANYNAKIKTALANGETLTRQVQVGFDPDTGEPVTEDQAFDMRPLPHIVVIVDEMAELMLMVGKDIEAAIQSIAQKARAAGIHMIMATQRPSVDVITGTIKANFPSRISFAVSSKIDSRTVLNEMGAEQLLGQGDMLYQPNGGRTTRVHGPFASDDEVEAVVAHLRQVGSPDYVEAIIDEEALEASAGPDGLDLPLFEKESSGDDLYDRAVQVVLRDKKASTSHVQRRLQIGYNRAANLIDRMEDEGLISSADHVGRRKIMVPGESADDPKF